MQGEAHRSETGTWVRYQAGNEPLLAHLESEDSPRVTIAWRGGVPLERLQDLFFHACPKVVSASWQASATADSDIAFKALGPGELPLRCWPKDVPGKPQFLRLEFRTEGPAGGDLPPKLVVWANLDDAFDPAEPSTLQQSIGIQLPRGRISVLIGEIAGTMAATTMPTAPGRPAYSRERARRALRDLRADLAVPDLGYA